MRSVVGSIFRLIVTTGVLVLAIEGAYRLYLYLKHPNYFAMKNIDAAEFVVLSQSLWQYDRDYGYSYVPALKVDVTGLKDGRVAQCSELISANEEGNFGPSVPDFDRADFRIIVLGDSFLRAEVTGPAWTKILGERLESQWGKTVRVLNLGRDGYGLPQMMTLANHKLKELQPSLVIFAFNGPALGRARSWRAVVGSGDDMRIYTSTENSPNPDPERAADTFIALPSATKGWCDAHLGKPPDERRIDPILNKLIAKHREIALKNGSPYANFFELRASYVYDLVRYRNPFKSQLGKMVPSANPELTYDDYRVDPQFMSDLSSVINSGIPYIFAHLALGKSISEGREFDLDSHSRKLVDSLRNLTGSEIYKTTDFVSLSPVDALRMCASPNDCHPSEFGHSVYADVASKMILKHGFR